MAIGVVAAAVPVGVFPDILSSSFRRSMKLQILSNRYANGEYQSSTLGQLTGQKSWDLTETLTAAQLTALREFWDDHDGSTIPFTYFDPFDTGSTGYIVRFDGAWQQEVNVGRRGTTGIRLLEVA